MLSKRICHRKGNVTCIFILRVTFEVSLHLPSLEFFFFFGKVSLRYFLQ